MTEAARRKPRHPESVIAQGERLVSQGESVKAAARAVGIHSETLRYRLSKRRRTSAIDRFLSQPPPKPEATNAG